MKLVRGVTWLLRALLFAVMFLFAIRNTDPVTLRFYFDQSWQAPLVLVMLASLALGAALGVVACLSKLFSQRRALQALKSELRSRAADGMGPPPGGMGA